MVSLNRLKKYQSLNSVEVDNSAYFSSASWPKEWKCLPGVNKILVGVFGTWDLLALQLYVNTFDLSRIVEKA